MRQLNLGTYNGNATVNEIEDGDVTVNTTSNRFILQLRSRCGSITINQKIDQHSTVYLTAFGSVGR